MHIMARPTWAFAGWTSTGISICEPTARCGPALSDQAGLTWRIPAMGVPEELKAFVISGTKKWAEIVKAAGIQPE